MFDLSGKKKIYLMGICGTAMASLAGIFKSLGHEVAGSDQNVYPPMSTMLQKLEIPIFEGFKEENLKSFAPDFVIVGNVISRSNPEAAYLLSTDIPYTSLPKAMGDYVIANRDSFVISGTHGKTTSTALLAWVLESLSEQPGFLIGGIPLNFPSSFRAPKKNTFVIEGDEYDTAFFDKVPKFVHYKPKHVILTSIEFDHADIYKDLEHVKSAFKTLLELIPEDGTLIYNAEDDNIRSILSFCKGKKVSFGIERGEYTIRNRENLFGRNQFQVVRHLTGQMEGQSKNTGDVALKMFGKHNTLNALGVYALAETLKWDRGVVLGALASFLGVKRRQEILLENSSYALIEDFAHHPTAVGLTLEAMREKYPSRRILAVFEPRSATSRRKVFQKEYVEAFKKADAVFLASPYDTSKIAEAERFSSEEVISALRASGQEAFLGANGMELAEEIQSFKRPGDVMLVMSNGAFDGIYDRLKMLLSS